MPELLTSNENRGTLHPLWLFTGVNMPLSTQSVFIHKLITLYREPFGLCPTGANSDIVTDVCQRSNHTAREKKNLTSISHNILAVCWNHSSTILIWSWTLHYLECKSCSEGQRAVDTPRTRDAMADISGRVKKPTVTLIVLDTMDT